MSPRIRITIMIIVFAGILAAFPYSGKYSLQGRPPALLKEALISDNNLSPDQVAKMIVSNDSNLLLIDLRSVADFEKASLPGAMNIPYETFLTTDLESIFEKGKDLVFYSDDIYRANYALVLAKGLGFSQSYIMKGGLKGWNDEIMNSSFDGEKLSARENAIYEIRFKARKIYNELNNMPDSLKASYRALKEIERKKLDGGCE